MSRHIPDNGICTACEAHQRAQKYIDRKDAKSNSIDCLSAARQKIGQITCGNCGEIYIMPQWRVDQGRVYCSLSCKNEGQRK